MHPFGITLVIITSLFPAFQLFTLPNITDPIALFSQYLGLAALILMAWGQIWASRPIGIELLFGGLDKIYILHKWAGITAIIAILLHDTIDAEMRNLGRETLLNEIAETFGEISLYGLLILTVISVATFIPYHLWKWTHKAMGTFFIASSFHFFFIIKPFNMTDFSGLYTASFCIIGIIAYIWTLLPEDRRSSHSYKIAKLGKTGDATAIILKPDGKAMKVRPGQFGILRFTGADKLEPHPFSFSKIFDDGSVRVTIKALGDFTTSLPISLELNQKVHINGPYGRFHLSIQKPQIWIAGGIGVTPFLAWAAALKSEAPNVHMFYCARSRQEAPHLDEIEHLARIKPNMTLHLFFSSENKRLTADNIYNKTKKDFDKSKISYCGPLGLRQTLQKDLKRYGLNTHNFHYEEFEFRTGIGMKKLAYSILQRTLKYDKVIK